MESRAYKENKLFHGSMPGAIRLKDMQAQVDRTKKGSTYKNAIIAMRNSTGVQVDDRQQESKSPESYVATFVHKLEKLLSKFLTASTNNHLISIGSSHKTSQELMRIASRFDSHLRDYNE
jgi:hypothetical protein